ncbi:LPXTG cell wall anchor domain-containing protein, partial [Staphylococcus hominis]
NPEQPSNSNQSDNNKQLPNTGETNSNATLFGTLFAALGVVLLGRRRKKDNNEK